jgi:hypothetical protein
MSTEESGGVRTESTTEGSTARSREGFYVHAVVGAVVTVLTSIVPFSPLIGGGVAGYLHGGGTAQGTRVGGFSGVIASLPLAGVFLVLLTVMSFGSVTTGEVAGPLLVVAIVGVVLLFVAVYTVGLSALGGYVGAALAESGEERRSRADRSHDTTLDEYAGTGDTETDR